MRGQDRGNPLTVAREMTEFSGSLGIYEKRYMITRLVRECDALADTYGEDR